MISSILEPEDLLDPFTVDWINKELYEYPVSYGHRACDDGDDFFGRIFFWGEWREQFHQKNLPASVDYLTNFVATWLPSATNKEFVDLRRIVLNAACPNQRGGVHWDSNDPSVWTVLYYITDSSGDTNIYDGDFEEGVKARNLVHTCKYKQGKFVAFPSTYIHNAEAPESGWRMSLAWGIQLR